MGEKGEKGRKACKKVSTYLIFHIAADAEAAATEPY